METVVLYIHKHADYESPTWEFTEGLTNKTAYAQIRDKQKQLVKNFTVTIVGNFITLSLAKADVAAFTVKHEYYSDLKLKDTITGKEEIAFDIKIHIKEANTQIPT